MPRPRVYDIDRMLDAAESLAAESGPSAVTIRAVAAAAAVSNGALYHTFGSRPSCWREPGCVRRVGSLRPNARSSTGHSPA
ncbi:bacterial regulatory s, tetR family protein [Mycobacterium xenopi 4042]|uniref:Bacterial regulatory s, tetR family protein n=1 Tax=Mycobacterium xenopi 4042 TaxID=1299334 RepID=X7YKT8_MYCXE|nr:bacterial regulatory s, tetR family protein [Mycobacterium xenopi 4042]